MKVEKEFKYSTDGKTTTVFLPGDCEIESVGAIEYGVKIGAIGKEEGKKAIAELKKVEKDEATKKAENDKAEAEKTLEQLKNEN